MKSREKKRQDYKEGWSKSVRSFLVCKLNETYIGFLYFISYAGFTHVHTRYIHEDPHQLFSKNIFNAEDK